MKFFGAVCAVFTYAICFGQSPLGSEIVLDPLGQAQLESGSPTRVIVQFHLTETAFDGEIRADQDLVRAAAVDQLARTILHDTFNATPEDLHAPSDAGPEHIHTFQVAAAMLINADQSQVEALASHPSVSGIWSDAFERIALDQSVPYLGGAILHRAGATGRNSTIAFLDSGVVMDHPAFTGRILDTACFATHNPSSGTRASCIDGLQTDTTSIDAGRACEIPFSDAECAHGTHVASIAAGSQGYHATFGSYALDGVAPGSRIISVNVFSSILDPSFCGGSTACPGSLISDQMRALEWLYQNRVATGLDVINMSLGGEAVEGPCDGDPRAGVIGRLYAENIVTVIASGNDGNPSAVTKPGCISQAVTVAGLNERFSSTIGNTGAMVDFAAPGERISAASNPHTDANNLTRAATGTSMATPHIAGAFAILMSEFPALPVSDIYDAITVTGGRVNRRSCSGDCPPIVIPRLDLALEYLRDEAGIADVLVLERPAADVLIGDRYRADTFNSLTYSIVSRSNRTETWEIELGGMALNVEGLPPGTEITEGLQSQTFVGQISPNGQIDITLTIKDEVADAAQRDLSFSFVGGWAMEEFEILVRFNSIFPRNDNIADRVRLPGNHVHLESRVNLGTYETGEPAVDGYDGSIWFSFVQGPSERYQMVLRDSPVHVYTGTPSDFASLVALAPRSSSSSSTRFDLIEPTGTEYFIQVHQTENSRNMRLSIGPVPLSLGSEIWQPFDLTTSAGTFEHTDLSSSSGAVDENDPYTGELDQSRTWFRWEAPFTGNLVLSNPQIGLQHTYTSSFAVFTRTDNAADHAETDSMDLLSIIGSADLAIHDFADAPSSEDRVLSVPVEQGRTYWWRVGAISETSLPKFSWGQAREGQYRLRTAILPEFRAGPLSRPLTAFLSVVNPANQGLAATNCRFEFYAETVFSIYQLAHTVDYQETNAQNVATGIVNAPFDLAPGQIRSFVIAFTPHLAAETAAQVRPVCDEVITPFSELDQQAEFGFVTSENPISDIISIAVTPTQNGILDLSNQRTVAYSVAAINNSDLDEEIIVTPGIMRPAEIPGSANAEICPTNPQTGVCTSDRERNTTVTFAPGEVRTFTVFVRASAIPAVFSPADFRAYVLFRRSFSDGITTDRGRTSVALRGAGD